MPKGVLFVCYGNACRSIMAEALTNHYWGKSIRAASAGIASLGHIPEATIKVLREVQVSVEGLYSKDLEDVDFNGFDAIVNLTDIPIERFIPSIFRSRIVDFYIRDPYGQSQDSYRRTREAVRSLVVELLPVWLGINT